MNANKRADKRGKRGVPDIFQLKEEVETALARNLPVVALESTVIAHGLPRPVNLETAHRVEQIVRDGNCVPATIAVLKGVLHVGLDDDQLEHLARSEEIHKLSRRDLPVAVANHWDGATTVATTTWIAERAGIEVFATGGIGGVHRGLVPDVSADLPELARSHLVIVCSGAKIVLDLPATREWLETHGITVVGYGINEMPAFYSRRSGLPIDVRADSPEEVARIAAARRALKLEGATLVCVPVPEDVEIQANVLQKILDEALSEAAKRNINGRELTPFLLSRMAERSDGATLRANIALLENNARVAAEIAVALTR
ncbi:MAG: pseudouridylate synthase [Acidobacteriota bacterium]|jgi:pseudouridine-5'-phosphate glycosidase|nr:pseudouridylate synthase [Acidobacteriota bacterium]